MIEVKEACPSCGSVYFAILRDMTSRRVCKCGNTWDVPEKFIFSKLRQELEKASLEIIRSRQYRGARESDYRAWLCDYVESNFVAKSDYDALKKENEKLLKFKEEMWKLGQAMPPNAISMMIQRELGKL